MKLLTTEEHRLVLDRLVGLPDAGNLELQYDSAGLEYTSVVICLFMHNLNAARSLLNLYRSFGKEWFPVTVGYSIARTMFEADVTAHYVAIDPAVRAHQYIEFGDVLRHRHMEACAKHRQSGKNGWREAAEFEWRDCWAGIELDVRAKYDLVRGSFETTGKKGKATPFSNWAGKSIRQMATEVEHAEAYDLCYTELCSFTHGDVHMADRFLHRGEDGAYWSARSHEGEVGSVFRYAAMFLTCMMEFMAGQFGQWAAEDVARCWDIHEI